ncbi:hypothetical protein PG996_007877 [Apiospora saccharicola]|uniref:Uncharacterized protein n=1 Tax=Apiospora saccharicola TaxID=335842 RepID=A0ABR1UWB1_9PEZI
MAKDSGALGTPSSEKTDVDCQGIVLDAQSNALKIGDGVQWDDEIRYGHDARLLQVFKHRGAVGARVTP